MPLGLSTTRTPSINERQPSMDFNHDEHEGTKNTKGSFLCDLRSLVTFVVQTRVESTSIAAVTLCSNTGFHCSNVPRTPQPEAFLWPPPPNSRATALTSTSPFERRLTRQSSAPFSLKNTTASTSCAESGKLTSPSVSSYVAPQPAAICLVTA